MKEQTPAQAITAHYMVAWGLPKEFHMQELDEIELAVVEFAPGRLVAPPERQLTALRFATNGMSAYDQEDGYRTELYVGARANHPWIFQFLVALAKYPMQYGERLCELDTIPAGGPVDRDKSPFTAFLITEPGPGPEAETLGVIPDAYPQPVFVHQVVAITEPEYEFALENGSEPLWERLASLGRPLLVDEARPDVVLGR